MKIILTEKQYNTISEKWSPNDKGNEDKIEKILNRTMPIDYSWWKSIKVESIIYINRVFVISGILTVDEEWGQEGWEEYQYDKYFPKNDAWEVENPDDRDFVSLGSIIGGKLGEEIQDKINTAFIFVTGENPRHTSINEIHLKFV